METKKVKLKYPLKREGEEPLEELTFREPTGKESKIVERYQSKPITGLIVLAAKLNEEGLSPEEIENLCAKDVANIQLLVGEWSAPDGF